MNSSNHPLIVETSGVVKRFGKRAVLSGVDFQMPAGVIYGISGPNGSGKSVFLRILTGLVLPNAGSVKVLGYQIGIEAEFPHSTGALVDRPGFIRSMSGMRNLLLLAKINGKATPAKVEETMRFVGLDPNDCKPVGTYSTGMRQRLGLAQAIMEDPELLILDEPTNGLDFEGQREIYSYLVVLRNRGKSILITSHNRDEIKILCDRAFTLIEGKLKEDSVVSELDKVEESRWGNRPPMIG
jgi:ABC-2 type transport system ATP-binding protein